MRAEQKIAARAHRPAYCLDESLGDIQRFLRRLPRVEGGIGACWIELDGREALVREFDGTRRRRIRIGVDVRLVAFVGV